MTSPSLIVTTEAHLLVPIDFSEHARRALQVAVDMVKKGTGCKLTLLTVVEPPTSGLRIQTGDLHKQMESEAAKHLQEWVRVEVPDVPGVETVVASGRPGDEICAQAVKRGVSLVVISTHGHTGLKHYVLGSVVEKVVRHAPCSVLVVR
jgi:universal stress protein A